ncbi:MAG: hypothetical protein A2W91_18335 [Bacteroidetes bacterium GWF2_38_335]|nr:MAG: hypothetical protein A2W91_18335 [Bacteroidetes bacterium GWF2_38_335]OFY80076.1 MAG: hypothetical protein A2281_12300 [Bacteroidetes bacterium RIFOXYA12_FULL_38_20]HBS88599.1 hypothetical protein [Bacteroidales bacterium]
MKNLYLIFIGIVCSFSVFAQNAPSDVHLNLELTQGKVIPTEVMDTLTDPMILLTSSDTVSISVFMVTSDTTTLSKIHVKLGLTDGGSELIQSTFIFDGTPPSGLVYFRDENVIKLSLGQFTYNQVFYCEVYFEDNSGVLSTVTKYSTN